MYKKGFLERYIKKMLAQQDTKPIFEEYKKLFGKYPGYCLNVTDERRIEIIKKEISEAKSARP